MDLQYRVFLVLAPVSATAALVTLAYAYRYRSSAPALISALARLVLALVGWLALNTLELLAPSPEATLLWAQLTYIFIAASIVAWIGFALHYASQERWLAPTRFAWLGAIPAATVALALSNRWHHLIWRSYEFVPVDGFLTMRVVTYGGWFVIQTAYAYLIILWGALLISRQYFRSFRLYRQQSALILAGALIPLVANVVYLLRVVPGLRKDYTAISFALASMAFAVGILRYRLFDLRPIARQIVVDNMADLMLCLDTQGRVVDLNPAARKLMQRLSGQGADDGWIGKPATQLPAPWPSLVESLPNAGHRDADVAFELDGIHHSYDARISPLVDRRGHLAGRAIVLRDVTERKQAEEQLRAYALELEAQNQELNAFAYMVAHDLKNPVSVLISYAEWLQQNDLEISEGERVQGLADMVRSGYKITGMIDDLLLLARLRSLDEVAREPLDMGRIVAAAQARFEQECLAYQAQIISPNTWPLTHGYAPWVEQVWANYLSNALKYGGRPEQGVPPRVELGFDEPAGSHVRFWVRDNGPGLTEAEQARLFTEFTRLGETRARGYGLGLAIVLRIVDKLDGQAGVESRAGEGSTFWFTLPREANAGGPPDV